MKINVRMIVRGESGSRWEMMRMKMKIRVEGRRVFEMQCGIKMMRMRENMRIRMGVQFKVLRLQLHVCVTLVKRT